MTRTKLSLALAVLVVASSLALNVEAREPDKAFNSPMRTEQPITGLAMDANGKYIAAVVTVETGVTNPLGSLQDGDPHLHLYDAKGASAKRWSAYHGDNHRDTTASNRQVVDVSSGESDAGRAYIAVGGPSRSLARWTTANQNPQWETTVSSNVDMAVQAVAVSDNGRVFAGGNTNSKGVLYVYDTKVSSSGTTSPNFRWSYNVSDAYARDARITTMEVSRSGAVLAVGTTQGILFFDARANEQPKDNDDPQRCCPGMGEVTALDLSRDGNHVIAGTANGFAYYLDRTGATADVWAQTLDNPAERIRTAAITLDGQHFAFGTDAGKIHFMAPTGTDEIAKLKYPAFNAKARVMHLDYDATGTALVAATDAEVFGFHKARGDALWKLGLSGHGVDGPVTGLAVSDDGERFVVSGVDDVLPFRQSVGADITVDRERANLQPGDRVKVVVDVENTGSKADTYRLQVREPVGWEVGGEDGAEKTVFPGESNTFNVTFKSPTGERPGYYDATIQVLSDAKYEKDATNQGRIESFTLNLSVASAPDIRIDTSSPTVDVEQDTRGSFPFTIRNLGNADAVVNLSARQDPSRSDAYWTVVFDEDQIEVGPGGQVTSSLFITAPTGAADGDYNDITIQARVGTSRITEVDVRARVSPTFGATLSADTTNVAVPFGESEGIKVNVRNSGNTPDLFNLSYTVEPSDALDDWSITLDRTEFELGRQDSRDVTLAVKPTSRDASDLNIRLVASSQGGAEDALTFAIGLGSVNTQDEGKWLPGPAPVLLALAGVAAALLLGRRRIRMR